MRNGAGLFFFFERSHVLVGYGHPGPPCRAAPPSLHRLPRYPGKKKTLFLSCPSSPATAALLPVVPGHEQSTTKLGGAPIEKTDKETRSPAAIPDFRESSRSGPRHREEEKNSFTRRSDQTVAGEGRILSIFVTPSLQAYVVCGEPLSSYFCGFSMLGPSKFMDII